MIYILAASEIEARELSLKLHMPRADWQFLGKYRDYRDRMRGIQNPFVLITRGSDARADTEEWQQVLNMQQATVFKEQL